jgi:hypothetical protein
LGSFDFWQITEMAHVIVPLIFRCKSYVLILAKNGLGYIFSQTHLVTLRVWRENHTPVIS